MTDTNIPSSSPIITVEASAAPAAAAAPAAPVSSLPGASSLRKGLAVILAAGLAGAVYSTCSAPPASVVLDASADASSANVGTSSDAPVLLSPDSFEVLGVPSAVTATVAP